MPSIIEKIEKNREECNKFIEEHWPDIEYMYNERLGMIFEDYPFNPVLSKKWTDEAFADVKEWMVEKGFNPKNYAAFIELKRRLSKKVEENANSCCYLYR